MALPFRYYLRVRYIECDAQKVVFNSRYSEYVDVSINEFLRAIGVLPEFLGTTSFTIGTTFRIAGHEAPIVTAETVYVLVNAETLTKLALPDSLREALSQGAAGQVTDHAAFL